MSLALLGMLVTGAAGLLFVNALAAAAIAAPLGFAMALACARAGPPELAVAHEASGWWPAAFGEAALMRSVRAVATESARRALDDARGRARGALDRPRAWRLRALDRPPAWRRLALDRPRAWRGRALDRARAWRWRPPDAVHAAGLPGWGVQAFERVRAAAPRRPPAVVSAPRSPGWGMQAFERVRAAAPPPAPATLSQPAHAVADGVAHLRDVVPAPRPEGWASGLRQAEREARRSARRAGWWLRSEGARALAARGAVAIDVGPRAAWALGASVLALALRVPLMLERHEILPGGDGAEYAGLARTFFEQGSASAARPPGYPLFLAAGDALPGRLQDAAIVLQLLLGAGLCGALVFVAWPLFGRLAAVVAGLLAGLTAPLLSIESILRADLLFGVLATGVAGLAAVAALEERRRVRWLLATGVAIACATYVEPAGHALVLAPLLALALAARSWRATLAGTTAVLAVVALLTAPWMVRNQERYGSFTMSTQPASLLSGDAATGERRATAGLGAAGAGLPGATRSGLDAVEPLRAAWALFALSGLAGALWLVSRSRRTRVAAGAAIGVWVAVAVGAAVLQGGHPRDFASLAALTFLLGAAGLTVAVKVAVQLVGVGRGTPCPRLLALIRNGATPSQSADVPEGAVVR